MSLTQNQNAAAAATSPLDNMVAMARNLPEYTITYRAPWIDETEGSPRWVAEQKPFLDIQKFLIAARGTGNFQAYFDALAPILAGKRIQILNKPGYEGVLVSHWEARRGETADKIDLKPLIPNVDAWRKTFNERNQGDAQAEEAIVSAFVAANCRSEQQDTMRVLGIGIRPSVVNAAVKTIRQELGDAVAITVAGTHHLKGQLEKSRQAVDSINGKLPNLPPVTAQFQEGVFSKDIGADAFAELFNMVVIAHYNHGAMKKADFYDEVAKVADDNGIVLTITNGSDSFVNLKDGPIFGHLFRPDAVLEQALIDAASKSAYKEGTIQSGSFEYSMQVPRLSDEDWKFIMDMPTGVYDVDIASRGENFVTAWNLFNFKFHVPLNALSQEERQAFLPELRQVLEANNNQMVYQVAYTVGYSSLLKAAASPSVKNNVEIAHDHLTP